MRKIAAGVALSLLSIGATAVITAAPAEASTLNGPISRDEVLDRAQNWVDRGITYTQTGTWATDPEGSHTYRRDCSGLVSMAWHLSRSYVTGDFQGSNPMWTSLGSIHDFQPGDAMVRSGHIELFSHWKSRSDHTQGAYVYSFNSDGQTVQNPYANNNFGNLGFNGWSDLTSYEPIRRTGLANSPGAKGPALGHDDGGGAMTIHRWTSSGSSFNRTSDFSSPSFTMGNVGDRMASGDVTGDGVDDIVMAYQISDGTFGFYVFKSGITSLGRWYTSGPYGLAPVGGRLVVADFNGDGLAEPAMVRDDGDGTMTIYRWLSTGSSFTRTTDYESGSFHLSQVGDRVASGDVTGDGKDDIVMAYQQSDGTFAYHVFNGGITYGGKWYTSGQYSLGPVDGRLVVGDFTGDRKAEPALVHDDGGGAMTIHRWTSNGASFSRTTDFTAPAFTLSNVGNRVASGDVTGDGVDDIVMAYQLGDGTFGHYVFKNGSTSLGRWYTSGQYSLGPVDGRLVLGNW